MHYEIKKVPSKFRYKINIVKNFWIERYSTDDYASGEKSNQRTKQDRIISTILILGFLKLC